MAGRVKNVDLDKPNEIILLSQIMGLPWEATELNYLGKPHNGINLFKPKKWNYIGKPKNGMNMVSHRT